MCLQAYVSLLLFFQANLKIVHTNHGKKKVRVVRGFKILIYIIL